MNISSVSVHSVFTIYKVDLFPVFEKNYEHKDFFSIRSFMYFHCGRRTSKKTVHLLFVDYSKVGTFVLKYYIKD